MSEIWRNDGETWSRLPSSGFEDEAALHQRIAEAPKMLPLSGQPRLAVVGSEVRLGTGRADVLAVELEGRPVVSEVKLKQNDDARQAVVAQALAYAAYLHGTSVKDFEDILSPHLQKAGHDSLADAMRASDQEGAFDEESFRGALAKHLRDGSFRIVFVLDDTPPELVRLASYLETIADRITVDLVTVGAYEVGDSQILLPQRVDPERMPDEPRPHSSNVTKKPIRSEGSARFREATADAPAEEQASLIRLADWADALLAEGLVRLQSVEGVNGDRFTLVPVSRGYDAGLATGWNERGRAFLQLWPSVIERRGKSELSRIEQAIAPQELRQGASYKVSDELLDALSAAYRQAAGGSHATGN